MGDLRDLAILNADDVAGLGGYPALIDALEAGHRRPPAAVERIGSDRILFGTDTPLYWAGAQKGRIETAEIDEAAKRAILYGNAARLLGIEATQ